MSNISAVIIVLCFSLISGLEEGDSCIISSGGQKAKCVSLLKCPTALQHIQKQQVIQPCGFDLIVLRVCCDDFIEDSVTSTINEPVTQTKTTIESIPNTTNPSTLPYVNPFASNSTGHKTFEKCVEYSNLVETFEKPIKSFRNKKEEEVDTCGFDPLIKGGVKAGRREFPHMVEIGFDTPDGIQWLCGGSLISERYVMTAGFCLVSNIYGVAKYARMGVTQIEDANHRQDIAIIEAIKHPQYQPSSLYNSIGLLKLEQPASLNRYVRPACLNFDRNNIKLSAVATGWGQSSFIGDRSNELLKVTLDLVDSVRCHDFYKTTSTLRLKNGIVDELQICAGTAGRSTCQGDGGGPLQIYSNLKCMYEIIGITTFGPPCGYGKMPDVFTRVSYYIDWIEKTVWG